MTWHAAIWLLSLTIPFILIQGWLHREIIQILLLITHRTGLSISIFSLIFLPGVFLHELSHLLVAWLLRVKTGRISLLPKPQANGRIRLGYVEIESTDFLRDSLIGAAPLLSGTLVIAFIGLHFLDLGSLGEFIKQKSWQPLLHALISLPSINNFLFWFYLILSISGSMLPSESDRRSWFTLIIFFSILVGLILLAGGIPWMVSHLAPLINPVLLSLALIFAVSLLVHLCLWIPMYLLRRLLSHSSC